MDELKVVYMPLGDVQRLDGNPKLHDMGKIIASINKHGFKDPPKLEPSLNDGRGGIVEGNGRTEALTIMHDEWRRKKHKTEVPRGIRVEGDEWLVPILVGVDSHDAAEAKAYALDHNNITAAGGDFTALDMATMYDRDAYLAMLIELNQAGEEVLTVDGDDLDLLLNPDSGKEGDGESEENYIRKIESPHYIPTGDQPAIGELYDRTKTIKLLREINEADDLPDDIREFLRYAAERHTIFNFSRVAEFYAHASEPIQNLMENSALVIVDFRKAIELGLVAITEEIREMVREEYGDE